jgi:hypothetical protein
MTDLPIIGYCNISADCCTCPGKEAAPQDSLQLRLGMLLLSCAQGQLSKRVTCLFIFSRHT